MDRLYDQLIAHHFSHNDEMMFLAGPRQVGKTTTSLSAKSLTDHFIYLNWDNPDHQQLILQGPRAIVETEGLTQLYKKKPIIAFDEIHKYYDWKNFLKGFYDVYHEQTKIIVTGSARLDIFKSGGDSLMGRYFLYHMHPLSIAELIHQDIHKKLIVAPRAIDHEQYCQLLQFGGFPKPFLKGDDSFSLRWQRLRHQQLIREDIRDASQIQDISKLDILTQLLKSQSSQSANFSQWAKHLKVSSSTVHRWVETLSSFYYCFLIKPWSRNISRSLIKEPKIYLWDWSVLQDLGARAENFIAVHLKKATDYWNDQGLGDFGLYYLRDLEKREVDFVVTRDQKPWFLVEVKNGPNHSISKHLYYFQEETQAPHAFQVVIEMDYVDKDCFSMHKPTIVPAQTFLSQLV